MAAYVLKFVDSVTASPTVRLDLNTEVLWFTREFSAPPPRLRRQVSSNTMTDGVHVSSSSYDARTLTITFDLVCSTQDISATEMQKLARELDRTTNILMYQPNGLTKPVFFKTYRSDVTGLVDFAASAAFRQISVEILAEPFAVGLRETINVGTVNNSAPTFDIAAASILGDVAAPCVLVDSNPATLLATADTHTYLFSGTSVLASDCPIFVQAESLTMGDDTVTAVVGGASGGSVARTIPDVASSNTVRLTYAPTGATARAMRRSFQVYAVGTGTSTTTSATFTFSVRYGSLVTGTPVVNASVSELFTPTGISRVHLDLGTVSFDSPAAVDPAPKLEILASVSTITGSPKFEWDLLILVPLSEATHIATVYLPPASVPLVIDGETLSTYYASSTAIFSTATAVSSGGRPVVSGGYPRLVPGSVNRFVYAKYAPFSTASPPNTSYDNAATGTLTIQYQPRYMHIRPVST